MNRNENLRQNGCADEDEANDPLFPGDLSELNALPGVLIDIDISNSLMAPLSQLIQFHLRSLSGDQLIAAFSSSYESSYPSCNHLNYS